MKTAMAWLVVLGAACGGNGSSDVDSNGGGGDTNGSGSADAQPDMPGSSSPQTIFVIPMENESSSAIYGSGNAPYINNTLIPIAAYTTKFTDELPALVPSEPHYVWMEAGTNSFSDMVFLTDSNASGSNSTASTDHLVTQLKTKGLSWMSYQEGMTAGTCPISSISGTFYAAKHDPFVFFQDVSGNSPSASNAECAAHHKPYSAFEADLAAGTMPAYVFITPNLCHDMHGASACPSGTNASMNIKAGDTWLSSELPRILAYATAHNSVIYLVWDEGSSNQTIPFLAMGPHVKPGQSTTTYSHSSLLKSIEEQLGVPVLSKVSSDADFTEMFQPGSFP